LKSSLYRTEVADLAKVYPTGPDRELPVLAPAEIIRAVNESAGDPESILRIYLSLQYWKDQSPETWLKAGQPGGWPAFREQFPLNRIAAHITPDRSNADIWIELLFLICLNRHADRDALKFYRRGVASGWLGYRDLYRLLSKAPGPTKKASRWSLAVLWSRLKAALFSRLYRETSRAEISPTSIPADSEFQAADSTIARKPTLAFVVPRFGTGFSGGIERLSLEAAKILAPHYHIMVYTTCAKDYLTWANEWPAGETQLQEPPITIRRFEAQTRNLHRFVQAEEELKSALHGKGQNPATSPTSKDSTGDELLTELTREWLIAQGPISDSLEASLVKGARSREFEAVVFFAFQYSLTPRLAPAMVESGIPVAVVPAAHPDWTLDIPALQRCLSGANLWITSTPEEQTLLSRTLRQADWPIPECMPGGLPIAIPEKSGPNSEPDTRFALYVGRLDPSKGVDQLIQFFLFYRMAVQDPLDLVLVGNPAMAIPEHPSIRVVGFVSDDYLNKLYDEATVLINPSPYESLSIVLLEAWARGLPTLSNGNSDVLEAQTARSNCGLCYRDLAQFIRALEELQHNPGIAKNGPGFVRENYDVESIAANYLEAMDYLIASTHFQE